MSGTRSKRNRRNGRISTTFVKLDGYVLRSAAYRSLSAVPRAIYTELRRRFNGRNNGEIPCSVRDLAAEIHCGKDTASNALRELQEKGFIRMAQPGSFNYKVRHATTWILTEEELNGRPATKDFMRWQSEKSKPGTQPGTASPQSGTDHPPACLKTSKTVLQ